MLFKFFRKGINIRSAALVQVIFIVLCTMK